MKIFAVSFLVSISSVFALTYETGTPYRYSYSTDVLLNEPTNEGQLSIKSSTGFKLDSNVQVTLVWKNEQNILGKLEILECKLTSAVPRNDADNVFSGAPCNQVTKDPIYVHFKDSKIVQLFASTEDPTPSVNIKRGIASLFQVNKNGGREVDASGDCLVHYINTGNNVIKSKDYTSCIKPDSGEFTSPRVILGLIRDSAITTTYVLSDDKSIIKSATSVESHVSRVTMRKALSSAVLSRQSLSYLNSEGEQFTVDGNSLDEAIANLGNNYLSVSPITDFVQQHCTKECRPAAEIVAENREHLKSDYLAKVELSSAYLTVLEKFRNCGKEEILSILMDDNNQEIVPQLIDIVAVTQTNAAHEAMVEILDFNNADMLDLIDRYLVSVSYLSHPSHDILENLLKISKNDVENEKIRESVALSLGALVHTLCLLGKCDSQIVQDTSDWFKEALDKYEEDTDKVIFLRAMSNSKLSDHVPLIANYAVHGKSSKVHVAALESLKMFDGSVLTAPEVRQSLNEIYHQNHRKYESAARSNAAGLILNNNPSQQEITNLVLSLTDQDNLELTAFMQRKIKDVLKNNVKLRRSLEDDIMKDPRIFNYDMLARSGMSISFSNTMADTGDVLSTYALDMLMSKSGILRQSYMDVLMDTDNDTATIVSVGIFATGLDSFLGEAEEADDNDAASGLGLNIMDVMVRPFHFFNGYSEMMGMMWSMTADNIITALAGTILLHDHSQRIALQSGINVDNQLRSSLSLDLSGSVEVSLWDKNSLSLVSNGGAMVIKGSTSVDAGFGQASLNYVADAEAIMHFTTSVDFSDQPVMVCLQMSQPAFEFRHKIKKEEKTPSSEKPFVRESSKDVYIPEKTYLLHPENSIMCDMMFGEDED